LTNLLNPAAGREQLVQGALEAQPEPPVLEERVLFTLATQSSSSNVRRQAATKLHSRDLLEQCCAELKEKDKTVYRELKGRVDAFKLNDERHELAKELLGDCGKLVDAKIPAQVEAVAVAQARLQTLEQKAKELNEQDATIGSAVMEKFMKVGGLYDSSLQTARTFVRQRKELKMQLASLPASISTSSDLAAQNVDKTLAELDSSWKQVPDHSDLDTNNFERDLKAATQLYQERLSQLQVTSRWTMRINAWENAAETDDPTKMLRQVTREWESGEKPKNSEQLAALEIRIKALQNRLEQRERNLAQKRSANSEQLLGILNDFEATMESGEFKKAMSLNDKLKARAANRELEAGAKKRIEDALKKAQPKLEEFRKWRHFGTQQARENLIGEANTLTSVPPASPKALSVAVKGLRESWKKLDQDDGRASETQWQAFSKACKEAYKPAKKHFDQLAKDRKTNMGARKMILEALETLLNETDWSAPAWIDVAKAHKELVVQWQRAGTVDFKVKKELDASFESVNVQLEEQFKEERESEMQRRRRLIDNLKAQLEADTGGRLASAAKRAQRDWRPTVQGDRKTEQALWKEFRGVCDDIFGSLKQQQKDAKTAWQAEVTQREEMCESVIALLGESAKPESGEFSIKDANQASGKKSEYAKSWKERHQIPSGIMSKLDARFKQATQEAESRIAAVMHKEEERAVERLDTLLNQCQRAEEALLTGEFDVEAFDAQKAEFEGLRGVAAKNLQKRFDIALKGMNGDDKVVESLQASLTENLEARNALCLIGELVADIDSPEYAQQERMKLKMKRLTEAMQGDLGTPEKELAAVVTKWYSMGGVAASEWIDLHARFEPVRTAQVGRK